MNKRHRIAAHFCSSEHETISLTAAQPSNHTPSDRRSACFTDLQFLLSGVTAISPQTRPIPPAERDLPSLSDALALMAPSRPASTLRREQQSGY